MKLPVGTNCNITNQAVKATNHGFLLPRERIDCVHGGTVVGFCPAVLSHEQSNVA